MFKEMAPYFTSKKPYKSKIKIKKQEHVKLEIIDKVEYARYKDEKDKFIIRNRDLLDDDNEQEIIDGCDREFEVGKIIK